MQQPNPRLNTDVENARLKGSLIRHGLAALRYADPNWIPTHDAGTQDRTWITT